MIRQTCWRPRPLAPRNKPCYAPQLRDARSRPIHNRPAFVAPSDQSQKPQTAFSSGQNWAQNHNRLWSIDRQITAAMAPPLTPIDQVVFPTGSDLPKQFPDRGSLAPHAQSSLATKAPAWYRESVMFLWHGRAILHLPAVSLALSLTSIFSLHLNFQTLSFRVILAPRHTGVPKEHRFASPIEPLMWAG